MPNLPPTAERVPLHSPDSANRRIHDETVERIERLAKQPERIEPRLAEIEREWDIERTLELNAATIALLGLTLGAFVNRRWLLLPTVVAGFLAQHALQGWCPPIPVFRRLGVRTQREIEQERQALKLLRGDLMHVADPRVASEQLANVFAAVQK